MKLTVLFEKGTKPLDKLAFLFSIHPTAMVYFVSYFEYAGYRLSKNGGSVVHLT